LTGIKFPSTASLSRFQSCCDGHVASEGWQRRKLLLGHKLRGENGSSVADPIAVKNARLFI